MDGVRVKCQGRVTLTPDFKLALALDSDPNFPGIEY